MFDAVRTRKTFEEAVGQIVDAIRAGDLRRGDRLPSERALASRMRISRPSLRKALRLLADAGAVEAGRLTARAPRRPAQIAQTPSSSSAGAGWRSGG